MLKNYKQLGRSVGLGLAILAALVIYAYGFKVTQVNLAETKSPNRQVQLTRVLRALAKPDLFEYKQEQTLASADIMVPCPAGAVPAPQVDKSRAYIIVTPSCAAPGQEILLEGFNFKPGATGPASFIPPSAVELSLGDIDTGTNGHFLLKTTLPKRASPDVQHITVTARRSYGLPSFSQTARDTWDKIVETVFMALLATTIGIFLAIPLSFFAARNLMKDVTSPLLTISLNLVFIPLGIFLGMTISNGIGQFTDRVTGNPIVNLGGLLLGLPAAIYLFKWAMPQEEDYRPVTPQIRIIRWLALAAIALLSIICLFLLSNLLTTLGDKLLLILGSFGFLGKFFSDIGAILRMLMVVLTSLASAGLFSSLAGKLGLFIVKKSSLLTCKVFTYVLAALAGALFAALFIAGLNWLYEFPVFGNLLLVAAVVGTAGGLVLVLFSKDPMAFPTGMVIYYAARTIFNALRSIEALIMVIVFVVWVGIGPFAGVLALSLHSVAALAKLYSEQVESILSGPVEAVKATGANRLQTIVYAIVPQIIPPYISFTMYRWDINVRMSTIIGFAGGGGIGFLLIQNINLLNYRAASTQMLAIAIVVASMDYLSSRMREKVI